MFTYVADRVKEMSSWSGGVLIAMGALILLGGPFVHWAAWACLIMGVWSVIKKD